MIKKKRINYFVKNDKKEKNNSYRYSSKDDSDEDKNNFRTLKDEEKEINNKFNYLSLQNEENQKKPKTSTEIFGSRFNPYDNLITKKENINNNTDEIINSDIKERNWKSINTYQYKKKVQKLNLIQK